MNPENAQSLEDLYKFSNKSVRRFGLDKKSAENSYSAYVAYLKSIIDLNDKSILDVGCGNGWSSYFLAEHAKSVTGIDLHQSGFEPQLSEKLSYKQSSATDLKFNDNTFDIVTTHECLEHIPDPMKALNEFDRVLKPGGYLFIVGPNLFSLLQTLRGLLIYVWKNRPLSALLFRSPSMPRHPYGNTIPELIYFGVRNFLQIFRLYLLRRPLFLLREPDLNPPFHADNDAVYHLNPLDLKFFFQIKGYEILDISGLDRSDALAMIPSGTWFAAKKKRE